MLSTLRLSILMLVGAIAVTALLTPTVGGRKDIARAQLSAGLVGAIGGFTLELMIRRLSGRPQRSFWRFSMVELLGAMTVAAIGLAIATAFYFRAW
jgi:hypothetical protein